MGKANQQEHPHKDIQRRGRAYMVLSTAHMLDNLDGYFEEILRDDADYLHYDEYRFIKRARKYVRWSARALHAVGRKLEKT